MLYRPDTLVLSSGAEKGMAEIGALECLAEHGVLSELRYIIGCSVGAIIGYLLAIGCTPREIMALGLSLQLLPDMAQFPKIARNYALLDHSVITGPLTQVSLAKLRKIPTLAEIAHEHGIHLIIPTVNIACAKPEVVYLDYTAYPDMTAIEAVRRSISIQPLFAPVYADDGIFVDGAIIDPFPVGLLDDGQHTILGIHMEVCGGEPASFVEHMSLITSILVDRVKRISLSLVSDNVSIITVQLPNTTVADSEAARLDMYFEGYFEAQRFVRSLRLVDKPKQE